MFVKWRLRVVALVAWPVVLIVPVNPRTRLSHHNLKRPQRACKKQNKLDGIIGVVGGKFI